MSAEQTFKSVPCTSECWLRTYGKQESLKKTATVASVTQPGPSHGRAMSYTEIQSWQIRLLEIHPGERPQPLSTDLHVVTLTLNGAVVQSLGEIRPYDALSYSWGRETESATFDCGGREVEAQRPVCDAMIHLRNTDASRFVWIDALCINQFDDDEKSIQVSQMSKIYCMANDVVVWLGLKEQCGGRAIEYLDRFARNTHSVDCQPGIRDWLLDIVALLTRPWFRRTWIRQEVFAARLLSVQVGDALLGWEAFRSALSKKQSHGISNIDIDALLPAEQALTLRSSLDHFAALQRSTMRDNSHILRPDDRSSLLEDKAWLLERSLRGSRSFLATNPRDYIYGLVSMTSCRTVKISDLEDSRTGTQSSTDPGRGSSTDHSGRRMLHSREAVLPLSYSRSTSQVFSDAMCYIINLHRSLDVIYLATAYRGHKDIPPLESDLPSWTPDWRSLPSKTFLDSVWKWFFVQTVSFEHDNGSKIQPAEHKRDLGPAHFLDHFAADRPDYVGYAQIEPPLSSGRLHCTGTALGTVPAKWHEPRKIKISMLWGLGPGFRLRALLDEALEELDSTPFLKSVVPTTESLGPGMRTIFGAYELELWFVPTNAREGDLIVRLVGSLLPAILRPTEDLWQQKRCYRLIGPLICVPNCSKIMKSMIRKSKIRLKTYTKYTARKESYVLI